MPLMGASGHNKRLNALHDTGDIDMDELMQSKTRPALQRRTGDSHMITIPADVTNILGLSHGAEPTVQFAQEGLVVLDFRESQEVATDGGE